MQGSGCSQSENEVNDTKNLCKDVSKAVEANFKEKDRDCIIWFMNAAKLGERFCNRTVNRLKNIASHTDVNATINAKFCDGIALRGFSATLNGAGLKWVSDHLLCI